MSTTPIPGAFPSNDPQALAHVEVTEVVSAASLALGQLAKLRQMNAAALAETSVEYQVWKSLEEIEPILERLVALIPIL
jgi:hypothetical protein